MINLRKRKLIEPISTEKVIGNQKTKHSEITIDRDFPEFVRLIQLLLKTTQFKNMLTSEKFLEAIQNAHETKCLETNLAYSVHNLLSSLKFQEEEQISTVDLRLGLRDLIDYFYEENPLDISSNKLKNLANHFNSLYRSFCKCLGLEIELDKKSQNHEVSIEQNLQILEKVLKLNLQKQKCHSKINKEVLLRIKNLNLDEINHNEKEILFLFLKALDQIPIEETIEKSSFEDLTFKLTDNLISDFLFGFDLSEVVLPVDLPRKQEKAVKEINLLLDLLSTSKDVLETTLKIKEHRNPTKVNSCNIKNKISVFSTVLLPKISSKNQKIAERSISLIKLGESLPIEEITVSLMFIDYKTVKSILIYSPFSSATGGDVEDLTLAHILKRCKAKLTNAFEKSKRVDDKDYIMIKQTRTGFYTICYSEEILNQPKKNRDLTKKELDHTQIWENSSEYEFYRLKSKNIEDLKIQEKAAILIFDNYGNYFPVVLSVNDKIEQILSSVIRRLEVFLPGSKFTKQFLKKKLCIYDTIEEKKLSRKIDWTQKYLFLRNSLDLRGLVCLKLTTNQEYLFDEKDSQVANTQIDIETILEKLVCDRQSKYHSQFINSGIEPNDILKASFLILDARSQPELIDFERDLSKHKLTGLIVDDNFKNTAIFKQSGKWYNVNGKAYNFGNVDFGKIKYVLYAKKSGGSIGMDN